VQNEVVFCVRDIDNKPVILPNTNVLTIHVIDIPSDTVLMQRDLIALGVGKGLYQLVVLSNEMDTWPEGSMRWNIVCNRGTDTVMLWTDLSYSPSGALYIDQEPYRRLTS